MPSFPVQFREDFDRLVSLSEKQHLADLLASNDAFTAAMRGAMKGRYRERVKEGIIVDTRPWVGKIIRGDAPMSILGSPAAMCVESGGPTGDRVLR